MCVFALIKEFVISTGAILCGGPVVPAALFPVYPVITAAPSVSVVMATESKKSFKRLLLTKNYY